MGNGHEIRDVTYVWEPAAAIWSVLTNADRHADWYLMPCLRMGARAGATCAWGEPGREMLLGRVTAFRPSSGELAHTLQLVWTDEPEIEVEWNLDVQGEVTEVELIHRIPAGCEQGELLLTETSLALMLSRLKTLVETGDPMPWPSNEALVIGDEV